MRQGARAMRWKMRSVRLKGVWTQRGSLKKHGGGGWNRETEMKWRQATEARTDRRNVNPSGPAFCKNPAICYPHYKEDYLGFEYAHSRKLCKCKGNRHTLWLLIPGAPRPKPLTCKGWVSVPAPLLPLQIPCATRGASWDFLPASA